MADDTRDPGADALQALQGADPAPSAPDPDIDAIRARAIERSAVVPLRKRRTAMTIGAVAAGVVLLAGVALAGAAVGRVTAPSDEVVAAPAADEGLPVVGGASPQLPTVAGQAAGGGAPATMPGPASMGAETSADKAMIYPGYSANLVPGPDLPDVSGTAPGYRLDSAGIDPEALARQLATAFGVAGKPAKQEFGWMVGVTDGTKPSIWVSDDAMVSWSYSDPTSNPWACGDVGTAEPAPADGGPAASGSTGPSAPESCDPSVKPISERDAVRATRKLLSSLGVADDPAAAIDIEWEAGSDDYSTWVTAWQRVNGQRTQLAWSFTFAGDQVAWANGFAAGLEAVPAYPIVGAKTAVQRSSDPRFASFGPTPLDGVAVPLGTAEASSSSSTPSVRQGNPERVQVWWDPATVTSAEPTLAQYWQPDGTLLILPAYRLTTAGDRGTWAVIAIAESAVEFVAPTP